MLDKGCSYPSARESAVREHMRDASYHGEALEKAISSSNNILGIEYLKALKRLGSRITPFTLQRVANEYNTEQLTGRISSATAIRRHISSGPGSHSEAVPARALPESTAGVLLREFEAGRGPVYPKSFERMVFSALRRMSPGDIMKLPYISEGLENRIKAAAENEGTLDGLIEAIVTKRYPGTRIRRSLFHLLTGLTAEEFGRFNTFGGPQYIRVLGFNQKGRKLLAKARKNSHLPVFVKAADIKTSCNPLVRRMIEIEAFSTDMYVLGYPGPGFRKGGQEFREGVRQLSN
jgi:predicted nucleotidyltransferase